MYRMSHVFPVIALLAGATLLAPGCATRRVPPPATPVVPAPVLVEPPSTVPDDQAARERLIENAIASARAEYVKGVDAVRVDQRERARAHFDRAVEILLDAPVPVASDPRLVEVFDDLVENVHAVELESVQNGAPLDYEETPAEELGAIEPTITPERAEEERALAEQATVTYDIPVVLNEKVLAWINIYSGRMRERFEEGLKRSGWYLDMIRQIFREEGLPEDLAYMAHVESSYKPYAYSRAKAKGVWQFISGTARRYGLRRDWWIDERSDPEMATRAAAAYLRDLYDMFGDWHLAMAAYNAGEARVQRAIARTGSKDFWRIAETSRLRLETRNYVPAILAATVISKSPARFGLTLERHPPVVYDKVIIDRPVDLRVVAKCAGTTVEELKRLNPALYRLQTPPNYPRFELRLPPGSGKAFEIVYASLAPSELLLAQQHAVARGETLAGIARRYGVTVTALASANDLKRNASLKAGTVLSVPTSLAPLSGGHPDRPGSSQSVARRTTSKGQTVIHRVSRGETLYSIAKRYGTTVQALRSANGMGTRDKLIAGRRLVIPRNGRASSTASASPRAASKTAASGSTAGKTRVTYRVKRGDTLFGIASAHGSTVDQICRWNDISRKTTLRIGTTLILYR